MLTVTGYLEFRDFCGLSRATQFSGLADIPETLITAIESQYEYVAITVVESKSRNYISCHHDLMLPWLMHMLLFISSCSIIPQYCR